MSDLVYCGDAEYGAWFNPSTLRHVFVRGSRPLNHDENVAMFDSADVKVLEARLRRFRFEVTNICNGDCTYCLVRQNGLANKPRHMSIEVAQRLMRLFKREVGVGTILIMGGEPLLNWDVATYLLQSNRGKCVLFTNGTMLNNSHADTIADCKASLRL